MRGRTIRWGLLVAGVLAHGAHASGQERPAHAATMYSCMQLPPGEPRPWVEAGVPEVLERLHPGWSIGHFREWRVTGLELFVVEGGRRAAGAEERFASVVGVDASGTIVEGAELFLRASRETSHPSSLAHRALGTVYRRARQRPLRAIDTSGLDAAWAARVRDPEIVDGELRFWIRPLAGATIPGYLHVDLTTGRGAGDW